MNSDSPCGVCGGGSRRIWTEGDWTIRRCMSCGTAFLMPGSTDGGPVYNARYFQSWYEPFQGRRRRRLEELLSPLRPLLGDVRDVLDVGCGIGLFLQVARRRGWNAKGQDTSRYATEVSRGLGFPVWDRPLPRAGLAAASFDLVTLWDVIAHLDNPSGYLVECNRLLRPGGRLLIKTPLRNRFLFAVARILSFTGRSRLLLHVPVQRFHFDRDSLREVGRAAGFEILEMRRCAEQVLFAGVLSLGVALLERISGGGISMIAVFRKVQPGEAHARTPA